jgi:hypothetical protein
MDAATFTTVRLAAGGWRLAAGSGGTGEDPRQGKSNRSRGMTVQVAAALGFSISRRAGSTPGAFNERGAAVQSTERRISVNALPGRAS